MTAILEILKYVIPSLVVFATAYYLVNQFLTQELRKLEKEKQALNRGMLTPIRLQAYERLILFLERISPSNMIMRISQPNMTVIDLQRALLQTVRDEYEHNLSQQIYVSEKSWELIKNAKEDLLKVINTSAVQLDVNLPSAELAKLIFESYLASDRSLISDTILVIKREVTQLF
jgi:hypothetical protein